MPRYRLLLISGVVGLAVAGCDNAQKTAAVDLRQCPKNDAQACATITPAAPTTTPAKPGAGKDAAKTAPAKAATAEASTAKVGASSTTTTAVKTTTTKQAAAARGHGVRVGRYTSVAANGREGRSVGRGYSTSLHGEKHGTYQRYHGEELLGGQDDRVTIERRYAGRPDLDHTQVYGGQTYGSRAYDGRSSDARPSDTRGDNRMTVERDYGRREEFNGYSRPPEDHDRGYSASRAQTDAARALAQRDERHGGMAQRQYSEQQYGQRGYADLPPPPPPVPPRPPLPPRPPVGYQDGRSHVQSGSSYSYEEQSRESHRSSSEQYSSGGQVIVKRRGPPPPPPRPPVARVPNGTYGPTSDLSGYRRAGQDDRGFLNWAGKVEY